VESKGWLANTTDAFGAQRGAHFFVKRQIKNIDIF